MLAHEEYYRPMLDEEQELLQDNEEDPEDSPENKPTSN